MMAGTEHHQDEIVTVANESPDALALPPAFGPLIRVSHFVMPLPVEVVVQRRQRDIGE
jgi:hypothetical protein